MPATVYTVGYEKRTVDDLVRDLRAAGVRTLVDVRELPLSRRRGFSKTKLREALEAGAIAYRHMRPLGNPKPYRELYWAGKVEAGAAAYREHLHGVSGEALRELAGDLDDDMCLLCVEHDHAVCHRAVIVDALMALRPGLNVTHL
jgi:uncharacterized protein (DUF488 family)